MSRIEGLPAARIVNSDLEEAQCRVVYRTVNAPLTTSTSDPGGSMQPEMTLKRQLTCLGSAIYYRS